MKPRLSAALVLAGIIEAASPAFPAEQLRGPVDAEVVRIVDGDTIEVHALIWLGQSVDVRVRINGVDAPEMEARCADERRRAFLARDYLVQRLGGGYVRLSSVVYDKYSGRVRATVSDGAGDVGSALVAKGLARPYHGERRQSWCADT